MSGKQIPFYPNNEDVNNSVLAVYKSLIEFFLDQQISNENLEKIGHYQLGCSIRPLPYHIYLAKHNVEVLNIGPFQYTQFYKRSTDYINSILNHRQVEYYLSKSNLMAIRDQIPEFLKLVHNIQRKPTVKDVQNMIKDGYLVVAEINSSTLQNKPNYSPQFLLVKSVIDNGFVINTQSLNELGNVHYSFELFQNWFDEEGFDCEVSGFKLS